MWNAQAHRELLRRQCRDSFWTFLLYGYGAYYNPKGKRWLDPSIHKPLCDWFEGHIKAWLEERKNGKGTPLYLMVLVPRDVGKTTAITQAGLAWMHLLDPDISTYIGSERTDFAVDILSPIKNVLSGDDPHSRFAWLYGNWCAPNREWKQNQVVHAARSNLSRKEPSFGIWGVESGITGKHPDVLCLDDPISYEKMAAASTWIQTVNNHVDSLVPVLPSDGCLIFVGTRYHDGDHFGVALQKEGCKTISGMPMPAVQPREDGIWHAYFLSGRDGDGRPAIPTVWSEDRLKHFQRKNPLRYAAQILNDPMNSEYNPVTIDQIEKSYVLKKDYPKNLRITLHMDCAFKDQAKQAHGDYSVITAMGHTQDGSGNVYHLGSWGSNRWRGEDFGEELIRRVQHFRLTGYRIAMMTDEQTPGGHEGAWELLLRNWFHDAGIVMPTFISLPRGGKKKVQRHVEAANFIVDGHVFFCRENEGTEELVNQLLRIGGSINDDYVDTFSDAFNDRCYQAMHRLGYKLPEGDPDHVRDPWDDYIRYGRGNLEDLLANDAMKLSNTDLYPPI